MVIFAIAEPIMPSTAKNLSSRSEFAVQSFEFELVQMDCPLDEQREQMILSWFLTPMSVQIY